jgi:hypothetical protein
LCGNRLRFDPSRDKLGAALSDLEGEPGDRLAMRSRHPRNGTLAHALTKGGDDVDLLVSGEGVHGANP